MQWQELIRDVKSLEQRNSSAQADIISIEYDSRRVSADSVFVAMRGGATDGNRYIATAVAQRTAGIVTDSQESFRQLAVTNPALPLLLVEHGRTALAQLSAAFFNHPERKLRSTGVTGTNGKTTTAFLTESLLNHAGRIALLVGTIENHIAGEVREAIHTTPESRDLFALIAEGVDRGATELVMEVSSHALDQGRVAEIGYDVAIFTNLTRDHLDYHQTMEAYFAAKRLLFDGSRYKAPRVAVLNADDQYSNELAAVASAAGATVVTYGMSTHANWRAEGLELTPSGAEFQLIAPAGEAQIKSHLAGEVNVLNLLGALAAAHSRGVDFAALVKTAPLLRPVPGRFQPVNAGQPFTVIVDYAHTDDALRNLTRLARQLLAAPSSQPATNRRVITLFGCGGDRDRTKRPKMGQAAGEGSDLVIVTSDNPRSEEPDAIIVEILPGLIATGTDYLVEPDRAAAIALALSHAHTGDVVLIAGKGHETQQVLRNEVIFFSDAKVALSALQAMGYGGEQ
ncbi:UDP-N-acetylmuramoyl-L-alanyl-D-glutamate--2,6-diaminopimelate ligase [Acidicapsa dinghuensis]|uniref:UDP-N-acetylmuramoyl-L-alanyl-D-glutamate--2,6-diaminopimelate ligase n=1 Tax=Acidicapsa dinghuensis TaxID=2218256 RepID=A0ABW1EJY2_9BACT|nr:UDP-N-acetylmuramoyl-L-alanyl-D-glutamate--2,6-diaminopimelate ligase [Acidicapsa dinghuensis]